jgi:hypothetical protein
MNSSQRMARDRTGYSGGRVPRYAHYRETLSANVVLFSLLLMACELKCPPGTTRSGSVCMHNAPLGAAGASDISSASSGETIVGASAVQRGAGSSAGAFGIGGSSGTTAPALSVAAAGRAGTAGTVVGVAADVMCRGNEGKAVCDASGILYVCAPDASAESETRCGSPALCQASLSAKSCLTCMPGTEHRCTVTMLEVCATDGKSFVAKAECANAALCNSLLGQCTEAVCEPNKFACQNNLLLKCNSHGDAFEQMQPCGASTCDAEGGQCDKCQPGTKTCRGAKIAICDETGQSEAEASCPTGQKCVGAGQCVECTDDNECASLTEGCHVGACRMNACESDASKNGLSCDMGSTPGTCMAGICTCVPQCNKPCGDSGCPGQPCPNTCKSGQMCSDDKCIDCLESSACSELSDDCNDGVCRSGQCIAVPQNRSCRDVLGQPSTCSGGRCPTCKPNCIGKCGGADGCGSQCESNCNPSTEQCTNNECVALPTGGTLYSMCSGTSCAPGLICFAVGAAGSRCYHKPPCTGNEMEFPLGGVCLVKCTTNTDCPTGTNCNTGGGGWCMAGVF